MASFYAATTCTATESRAKSSRDIIFDFDIGTSDIVACAKLDGEMDPDHSRSRRVMMWQPMATCGNVAPNEGGKAM